VVDGIPVSEVEDSGVDEGEQVAQSAESNVCGEDVVVVGVEELRQSTEYQIGSERSSEDSVVCVLDHWHWHNVVPLGCMSHCLRSYGSSEKALTGNLGLSLTAMLARSTIFFTLL